MVLVRSIRSHFTAICVVIAFGVKQHTVYSSCISTEKKHVENLICFPVSEILYANCYHKKKNINMHHIDSRIQTNLAMKFAVAPHFSGLTLQCFYTLSWQSNWPLTITGFQKSAGFIKVVPITSKWQSSATAATSDFPFHLYRI